MTRPSVSEFENMARERFASGYLCGEAVLRTLCEAGEVDSTLVPRTATGFCSGLARTCGPCGALMGAVLAVSLAHGRDEPDRSDAARAKTDDCYARVQLVVESFAERFGSINCRELTGCDLRDPQGQLRFREEGVIERCREYVAVSVALGLEAFDF